MRRSAARFPDHVLLPPATHIVPPTCLPTHPPYSPQEAVDLMQECASLDPAQRPTAQQALDRLAALLERQRAGSPSVA